MNNSYLIYEMKDGTKIRTTKPDADKTFLLYAVHGKKVLTMECRVDNDYYIKDTYFADVVSESGFERDESALLINYIGGHVNEMAKRLDAYLKLEEIQDKLQKGILEEPAQWLFRRIREDISKELYGWSYLKALLDYMQKIYKAPDYKTLKLYDDFRYTYPEKENDFPMEFKKLYHIAKEVIGG